MYVFQNDVVDIKVILPDTAPPSVFAVISKKLVSQMKNEWPEVELFCKRLEVVRERIKEWPRDDVTVYAESSAVFFDFVTDFLITQV